MSKIVQPRENRITLQRGRSKSSRRHSETTLRVGVGFLPWEPLSCSQLISPLQEEGPEMVMRAVSILVRVLALSSEVMAGEHPGTLRRMSCTAVRYYVAPYSASAAEQFARSKGATDADIDAARRCIKASSAQTASVAR